MFSITVTHNLSAVRAQIKAIELELSKPDLKEPSEIAVNNFQSLITKGNFAPLSPVSRKLRGNSPLLHKGELRNSIKATVRNSFMSVGSRLKKAPLLRFGGVTAAGSAIPGKVVPSRDYLEVTESLLDQIATPILRKAGLL